MDFMASQCGAVTVCVSCPCYHIQAVLDVYFFLRFVLTELWECGDIPVNCIPVFKKGKKEEDPGNYSPDVPSGPRGSHECSHGTITVLLLMVLSTTWLLREAEALLPLLLGSFPHTNITAQDRSPSACSGDLAPALLATSAPAPLPYCQFRREHGLHRTIKLKAKLKTRSLEAELQRALENAPLRF